MDEITPTEARKWLHVSYKVCDEDLHLFLDALTRQIYKATAKGGNRDFLKVITHIRDATLLAQKLRKAKYG